jgi:hypothetical protein
MEVLVFKYIKMQEKDFIIMKRIISNQLSINGLNCVDLLKPIECPKSCSTIEETI